MSVIRKKLTPEQLKKLRERRKTFLQHIRESSQLEEMEYEEIVIQPDSPGGKRKRK